MRDGINTHDVDTSTCRDDHRNQHSNGRGLSSAIGAKQAKNFPTLNIKGDVINGIVFHLRIPLDEMAYLYCFRLLICHEICFSLCFSPVFLFLSGKEECQEWYRTPASTRTRYNKLLLLPTNR
jgi:hypothetical protein